MTDEKQRFHSQWIGNTTDEDEANYADPEEIAIFAAAMLYQISKDL